MATEPASDESWRLGKGDMMSEGPAIAPFSSVTTPQRPEASQAFHSPVRGGAQASPDLTAAILLSPVPSSPPPAFRSPMLPSSGAGGYGSVTSSPAWHRFPIASGLASTPASPFLAFARGLSPLTSHSAARTPVFSRHDPGVAASLSADPSAGNACPSVPPSMPSSPALRLGFEIESPLPCNGSSNGGSGGGADGPAGGGGGADGPAGGGGGDGGGRDRLGSAGDEVDMALIVPESPSGRFPSHACKELFQRVCLTGLGLGMNTESLPSSPMRGVRIGYEIPLPMGVPAGGGGVGGGGGGGGFKNNPVTEGGAVVRRLLNGDAMEEEEEGCADMAGLSATAAGAPAAIDNSAFRAASAFSLGDPLREEGHLGGLSLSFNPPTAAATAAAGSGRGRGRTPRPLNAAHRLREVGSGRDNSSDAETAAGLGKAVRKSRLASSSDYGAMEEDSESDDSSSGDSAYDGSEARSARRGSKTSSRRRKSPSQRRPSLTSASPAAAALAALALNSPPPQAGSGGGGGSGSSSAAGRSRSVARRASGGLLAAAAAAAVAATPRTAPAAQRKKKKSGGGGSGGSSASRGRSSFSAAAAMAVDSDPTFSRLGIFETPHQQLLQQQQSSGGVADVGGNGGIGIGGIGVGLAGGLLFPQVVNNPGLFAGGRTSAGEVPPLTPTPSAPAATSASGRSARSGKARARASSGRSTGGGGGSAAAASSKPRKQARLDGRLRSPRASGGGGGSVDGDEGTEVYVSSAEAAAPEEAAAAAAAGSGRSSRSKTPKLKRARGASSGRKAAGAASGGGGNGVEGEMPMDSLLRTPEFTPSGQRAVGRTSQAGATPADRRRRSNPGNPATAAAAAAAASLAVASPDGGNGGGNSGGSASRPKMCNCKKSRCLKLYCDCFAVNAHCRPECRCKQCQNLPQFERERGEAVRVALERNANVFQNKVSLADGSSSSHNVGCNCRKSTCIKRYCECFQRGLRCGAKCKCRNCLNHDGEMPLRPARSNDEGGEDGEEEEEEIGDGGSSSEGDNASFPGTPRPSPSLALSQFGSSAAATRSSAGVAAAATEQVEEEVLQQLKKKEPQVPGNGNVFLSPRRARSTSGGGGGSRFGGGFTDLGGGAAVTDRFTGAGGEEGGRQVEAFGQGAPTVQQQQQRLAIVQPDGVFSPMDTGDLASASLALSLLRAGVAEEVSTASGAAAANASAAVAASSQEHAQQQQQQQRQQE